jgi:hypothetical protein
MKTLNELRVFCEGYAKGLASERDFYGNTLAECDDWVVWGEYDINFSGSVCSYHAKNDNDLHVDAYKAGWVNTPGEPIHSFTIFGETA